MSADRIERGLTRMAYQIFEDTADSRQLIVFGINERGYLLAKRITEKLSEIYGTPVGSHPIEIKKSKSAGIPKNPREKAQASASEKKGADTGPEQHLWSLHDKVVIIVDDVIYSGRTMYQALKTITDCDIPAEIRLAVLIDRGHRRFPFAISYTGMYCPTKLREHVRCLFLTDGSPDAVELLSDTR